MQQREAKADFFWLSKPEKKIKKMDKGEKLVADGSIVKLMLQPSPPYTPDIQWQKGCNAKFHYTVHAYVPQDSPQESKKHEHSGGCCSHKSKLNMNWIEELVNKSQGVLLLRCFCYLSSII